MVGCCSTFPCDIRVDIRDACLCGVVQEKVAMNFNGLELPDKE